MAPLPETESLVGGRSDAGEPVIEVDNLRKGYGDDVVAVDGVDFEIAAGSVVGILGPNGAGKTTLIKSILSLVVPSEGAVRVNGIDVQRETGTMFEQVGAVFEGARNVYWRLTPLENMRFFSSLAGRDPNEMRDRHERLLEQFDVADKRNTVVRELSRGQKQKVSIACTLARDAEFVFLDEPTLGLDVESTIELRSELRRLADDDGTTILLSSHDMDVIEAVCDRVIVLNDGKRIADGPVDELLDVFETQVYEVCVAEPLGSELCTELRTTLSLETDDRPEEARSFRVPVQGDEIYELVEVLRRNDVSIESLGAVETGLEDVFLRITDRDTDVPTESESALVGVSGGE